MALRPLEILATPHGHRHQPERTGGIWRLCWQNSLPPDHRGRATGGWSLVRLVAVAGLACLLGNLYIVGLNQLEDVDIDRINKPHLPMAAGEFTLTDGRWIVSLAGWVPWAWLRWVAPGCWGYRWRQSGNWHGLFSPPHSAEAVSLLGLVLHSGGAGGGG
jgi:hypothetical protein